MSEQKFLRPADGVKVRRPDGGHLAEAGENVEMDNYWRRRLTQGDVVEVKPAADAVVARAADTSRGKVNRE